MRFIEAFGIGLSKYLPNEPPIDTIRISLVTSVVTVFVVYIQSIVPVQASMPDAES